MDKAIGALLRSDVAQSADSVGVYILECAGGNRMVAIRRFAERADKRIEIRQGPMDTSIEQKLLLFDLSLDLLCIARFDGTVLEANKAWTRVLGFPTSEINGAPLFSLVHPDDEAPARRASRRLAAGNSLQDFEASFRCSNGETRRLSWNVFAVATQGVAVGVGRDVTAFRRQAAEASATSEKLRVVTEFTYDWEFWLGTDRRYLFISPSCERISGYEPSDFYENPALMYSIVHPDDRPRFMDAHRAAEKTGTEQRITVELRIIRRDGAIRWISHSCRRIRGDDGSDLGRRGSNTDITDRREADEREAQLERYLRQAKKMEALGTLAGGIAHDFNNVLAAITGYAQIGLVRSESGENIESNLREIIVAAKRGAALVDQILTFSSKRPGSRPSGGRSERRPVLLNSVCTESARFASASQPPSVDIRINASGPELFVDGDSSQFHQVVTNLCTNAVQALEGSEGLITVDLEATRIQEPLMIQSGELSPGYYARLSVQDSGKGIDPLDMERVFDPFFTTKQGGTGLGLSIVHGIAIGYGGGIDIESRLGSGTTVTVYLPAQAGTPPTRAEGGDRSREQRSPEGNRTIVFVDDEEQVLSTGAAVIESLGYTVKAFRSAESAVAFVREHRSAVSLVFADYIMPSQSGIDLAKALRLINPALPVVLCTGYNAGVDVTEREAAGIREVLKKPVFREDYESALRRHLG